MSDYDPKLIALPGASVSPELVLHRTLAKLPRIKSVFIIIQWDNTTYDCDWSSMRTSELCMAEKVMSLQIAEIVREAPKS